MKNNTVVTAGDRNYLWGLFLLIASRRKTGMDEPVVVGAYDFTPEAEAILTQLGDVTIYPLSGMTRSLTCCKPLVMLQAKTEYITWADSDAYFVGNCSERLPPLSPGEIHSRMRAPEEKITIVMVSHDIGFVSSFVNKIGCVNKIFVEHASKDEMCCLEEHHAYSGKTTMVHHKCGI